MKPMETIKIDGRSMAYRDEGEGPVLLFGHSYLWDSKMWSAQVDALSMHYRCIVPDLWAHGASQTLEGSSYSIEALAQDHLHLLDALGIAKAAVVGLSVGGMWATELALTHPERVAGLVLANTFVGAEPEARRARYFAMLETVEKMQAVPATLIDALMPLFFSPDAIAYDMPALKDFRESLAEWPEDKVSGMVAIGRGIFARDNALPRLSGLACPLLILAGQHDVSRPAEESAQMADCVPGARLKILNSGHISAVEQPAAVSEAIRGFLDEVDWL